MNLNEGQIRNGSRKVIGKLEGSPVIELATKGGLHLVVTSRKGRAETLGAGSHRAIARHIAMKKAPEIEWTELSKADFWAPEDLGLDLVAQYETMTDAIRKAEGC